MGRRRAFAAAPSSHLLLDLDKCDVATGPGRGVTEREVYAELVAVLGAACDRRAAGGGEREAEVTQLVGADELAAGVRDQRRSDGQRGRHMTGDRAHAVSEDR